MTTELACEQLILGWSAANLLGVSGMGPVATSPGWELTPRDTFGGLGEAARYLGDAVVPAGTVPPTALEYRPDGTGALLLAKVYSTASRRGGQYQVHAIRAPRGVSPWDLWSLATRGVLITSEVSSHEGTLERVRIRPSAPVRMTADASDAASLACLLQRLDEGRPFLIRAADQAEGVLALKTLLAYLPLGVAREVPVSTFVAVPTQWSSGIGLVVPPFSVSAGPVELDMDARGAVAGTGAHLALAEQLIHAAADDSPPPIRTLADLQSWLSLEQADLATVAPSTLRRAVAGPAFGLLLAKLSRHPRCGEVLLRILADSRTEEAVASEFGRQGPEHADLVATLVGLVGAEPAAPGTQGSLQSWLLNAVGADQFAKYVVPSLVAEAHDEGRVVVHSADLARVLALTLDQDDLTGFRFAVGTLEWSAVTEAEISAFVRENRPMSAASWTLIGRAPARAAAFIDDRLDCGAWREAALGRALARWPQESLTALMSVLTKTTQVPKDWPAKVLGQHPAPVVRQVLEETWPELAAHLGIPESVAAQLTVARKPWWRLGDG